MSILVLSEDDDPSVQGITALAHCLAVGKTAQAFSTELLAQVEVIFISQTSGAVNDLISDLWSQLPNLKWIHSQSAGVNHILCPPLLQSDSVTLTNARGVFSHSLAEYALLAMLYFSKDVARLRDQQKKRSWSPFVIEQVHGKTLGVVGYGDIGQAAAQMAKAACGVRVLALKRKTEGPLPPGADAVFGPHQLKELIEQSDFIVCAAPDTPLTRGMISKEVIAAMKSSAVLINVGRGTVVDEDALVEALRSGRIRGAALDVVEKEPLIETSELYTLENVLLSPHNADMTNTFREDSSAFFLELLEEHQAGKPLRNVVDKQAGY